MPPKLPPLKSRLAIVCPAIFILAVGLCGFFPKYLPDRLLIFTLLASSIAAGTLFKRYPAVFIMAPVAASFLLGAWRFSLSLDAAAREDNIARRGGTQVVLSGIVGADIETKKGSQRFSVKGLKQGTVKYFGKVLVTTGSYPEYSPGDKIEFACHLKNPEPFDGFRYDEYLSSQGIYSLCYQPEIISTQSRTSVSSLLWQFRNKAARTINLGLKEPEAGIAVATVLGDSSGLSDRTRELYAKSGLSHVIAISGLHISLLTVILLNSLIYCGLSRKASFYGTVLFLAAYVALIGFPASGLRGALMGFLLLWSIQLGRLNRAGRAVLLVCALNLLANPFLFRHNIGFQLSYLSTFGIILLYPLGLDLLKKVLFPGYEVRPWLDNILVTLAAFIPIIPIMANTFGIISIVSPISNLFIFSPFPFILISIIGAMFIGLLSAKLAVLAFVLPSLMVKYMNFVAYAFSASSAFYLTIKQENILIWIIYYLLLALILIKYYFNFSKKFDFSTRQENYLD